MNWYDDPTWLGLCRAMAEEPGNAAAWSAAVDWLLDSEHPDARTWGERAAGGLDDVLAGEGGWHVVTGDDPYFHRYPYTRVERMRLRRGFPVHFEVDRPDFRYPVIGWLAAHHPLDPGRPVGLSVTSERLYAGGGSVEPQVTFFSDGTDEDGERDEGFARRVMRWDTRVAAGEVSAVTSHYAANPYDLPGPVYRELCKLMRVRDYQGALGRHSNRVTLHPYDILRRGYDTPARLVDAAILGVVKRWKAKYVKSLNR